MESGESAGSDEIAVEFIKKRDIRVKLLKMLFEICLSKWKVPEYCIIFNRDPIYKRDETEISV